MLRNKIQALLYICLLALSFNTQAALMTCDEYQTANPDPTIDFAGGLVENAGCMLDTDLNNDSETAVTGFFGVNNWTDLGRVDFGGADTSGALWDYSGDTISGILTIDSVVWDTWNALMVVLKDGSNAPGTFIGYAILETTDPDDIYSVLSPYVNNGNLVDMSHITLYGTTTPPTRGCTNPADCPRNIDIPEPDHLFFFSLALLGGLVTTRQLKKDSRQL